MKFTYDEKADRGECVAFVDADGDLWFETRNGDETVCLSSSKGYVYCNAGTNWPVDAAIHKFYPGDSITITF